MTECIRKTFEREMFLLKKDLEKMGSLVEEALENTIRAFKNSDSNLALEIIEGDRNINDIEKSIESRCLSLILRQQPVARDLREVTAALKVITDMERIGDQSADIAELIIRMNTPISFRAVEHIPFMAEQAKNMVNKAVEAFINEDMELAIEVIKNDDVVDKLFNDVKYEVIECLKVNIVDSDDCIDFLIIAKYLERIGDHAVNICEWVEFNKTGILKNTRIL